eukprot:1008438-Rhodomonas_salina.9
MPGTDAAYGTTGLRARDKMSSTDLAYGECARYAIPSTNIANDCNTYGAIAPRDMRCPVLTQRMVLPGLDDWSDGEEESDEEDPGLLSAYALARRCPSGTDMRCGVIELRVRYAMSGIAIAYGTIGLCAFYATRSTDTEHGATSLCHCYAMRGTDMHLMLPVMQLDRVQPGTAPPPLSYALATRCPVLTRTVRLPPGADRRGVAVRREEARKELDYPFFANVLWPKLVSGLTVDEKRLSPSSVFSEIHSYIKGSAQALETPKGWLSRQEYLRLPAKMAPHFRSLARGDAIEDVPGSKLPLWSYALAMRCPVLTCPVQMVSTGSYAMSGTDTAWAYQAIGEGIGT